MKNTLLIFLVLSFLTSCSEGTDKETIGKLKTTGLPSFKYNPNALELGIIKKEKTVCPVCQQERDYVYTGPFYSENEVEGICPWCIKNGAAYKLYNGEFQDSESCEEVNNIKYLVELTTKTPGYSGYQQERWLSHCGEFCALKSFVGWAEIKHLKEELRSDLNGIKKEYDLTQDELERYLVKNGSMQGYLFQCLHCHKHRLTVDVD